MGGWAGASTAKWTYLVVLMGIKTKKISYAYIHTYPPTYLPIYIHTCIHNNTCLYTLVVVSGWRLRGPGLSITHFRGVRDIGGVCVCVGRGGGVETQVKRKQGHSTILHHISRDVMPAVVTGRAAFKSTHQSVTRIYK